MPIMAAKNSEIGNAAFSENACIKKLGLIESTDRSQDIYEHLSVEGFYVKSLGLVQLAKDFDDLGNDPFTRESYIPFLDLALGK